MKRDEYVIVVFTTPEGEEKRMQVKKGERIMLKNKSFIVAGVTPKESLGKNIRFEEVPKPSIKSLILSRKNKEK